MAIESVDELFVLLELPDLDFAVVDGAQVVFELAVDDYVDDGVFGGGEVLVLVEVVGGSEVIEADLFLVPAYY